MSNDRLTDVTLGDEAMANVLHVSPKPPLRAPRRKMAVPEVDYVNYFLWWLSD